MTNIILLGPPGCGKGTQSKILEEKNNFKQISTGDILRDTVKSGSKKGVMLKEIMERGDLVPDQIVIDMIIESIKLNKNKNIIFDGFPRNLNQAKALEKALEKESMKIDHVLLLEVNFNDLEERINKRSKESGSEKRKDDNVEILINRLKVYKEMTLPIISYYENKNKLQKVNGMMTIMEVNKKINEILN